MLKSNDDKTEFIIFGTRQQLAKVQEITIAIGDTIIQPVEYVRNLGFFMDNLIKNDIHINKLTSSLYHHLQNIHKIRGKMDFESAKTITQALIHSKVDYCNLLLLGTASYQLDKLQCIQNMACWVLLKLTKYDWVTEPMSTLHWLYIHERIEYQVASFMFNGLKGNAPQYLIDLIPKRQNIRQLWSSTTDICLSAFYMNTQAYNSSFASPWSGIWNSLPDEVHKLEIIEKFKKQLKTHLFTKSYDK